VRNRGGTTRGARPTPGDVRGGADAQGGIVHQAAEAEIETKNRELQDTIDELTRARIGRAKALTLGVVIVLFIFQDAILGTPLAPEQQQLLLLLAVKMAIIFSLSRLWVIEHHLLKGVMRKETPRARRWPMQSQPRGGHGDLRDRRAFSKRRRQTGLRSIPLTAGAGWSRYLGG
jgi:hypothetical protein